MLDHVTKPARGVFVLRESQVAEPTAKTALRAEDFYAGRVFVRGRWESGLSRFRTAAWPPVLRPDAR